MMRGTLRSRLALVPGVGLLLVGVLGMATALDGAPALDPEARQAGVFGDWRVPVSAVLYDRADYLFHLGYGYVQADLLASAATEAREDLAEFDVALARAERAESLLMESVAHAPGNAHAWAYLAWARALRGEMESAARAMETSWTLAPHSLQLAPTRLSFFDLVAELEGAGIAAPLTPRARDGAMRDVVVLNEWNRAYLAALVLGAPALADLARASGVAGALEG